MTRLTKWVPLVMAALVGVWLMGCGREDPAHEDHDHNHSHDDRHADDQGHGAKDAKEGEDPQPDHEGEAGQEHGHGQDDGSPSGASFKVDRGVILAEETRRILGVEWAEVVQGTLPQEIRLSVQMFGEKHRHAFGERNHPGCDVHGSALVESEKAGVIRAGQVVEVQAARGERRVLSGVVLGISRALALGESEILVGISNAIGVLGPGDFVGAILRVPSDEAISIIPARAVLRTAEGTFVYRIQDDSYRRTAVALGAESGGQAAVVRGVVPGDRVVVRPVEELWLIELRATKGGGHSH
jgi:hypothetical protein